MLRFNLVGIVICLLFTSFLVNAESKESIVWSTQLKNEFFSNRPIVESDSIIELEAPYRAEDPALVPVTITSKIAQTKEQYVKKITLLIDKNPVPFAGEFTFFPESGKADLALRLRVNTYTFIRAVAELNDGTLHMAKKFVKASGGCSAPLGSDLEAAMQRLGKMKFRLSGDVEKSKPSLTQLLISHPNITGMQMDQVSRLIKPAHYVETVQVSFDNKPVLIAKTDIAVSADPNFRFYFVPEKSGDLKAEIKDTKGKVFSQTLTVQAN